MNGKVLYIEDNDQNYYLVEFILRAKGYTVIRARDGREGIAIAAQEKPDIILLDIQLPVMDGYQTAGELRRCPDLHPTPIIALTSYAMPEDRKKAIDAGCTGYIEKPMNPNTFGKEIEKFHA